MSLGKPVLVLAVFIALLCIEDAHGAMRCDGFVLTDEPRGWAGWFVAISPGGRRIGWRWVDDNPQVISNGEPRMLDADKCEKVSDYD